MKRNENRFGGWGLGIVGLRCDRQTMNLSEGWALGHCSGFGVGGGVGCRVGGCCVQDCSVLQCSRGAGWRGGVWGGGACKHLMVYIVGVLGVEFKAVGVLGVEFKRVAVYGAGV